MPQDDPFFKHMEHIHRLHEAPLSQGQPGEFSFENKLWQDASSSPSLNVTEHDDRYDIVLVVQGLSPSDVQVQFLGNKLTIKGEAKLEKKEEQNGQVLLHETVTREFSRSVTLFGEVQPDKITAVFQRATLSITVPKKVVEQPWQLPARIDVYAS